MTVSPAFFQDEETRRLLEMAATAAALPMCLHSGDGLKISGWGGCEACTWVNSHGTGKKACRKCRSDAARLTLLEQVPVTFVCHMGFTCVIAAPFRQGGYTVVFGPFIPADAAQGVEFAVRQGLLSLDTSRPTAQPLPFSIKDVRVVPQGSVRAADRILRGLSRDCAPFFNTRHTYMPLVMASLHRDYASDKLLSRIAREAGVAPSSITRALEKMTGASFSEVLGRIRIHRACRLLRTTAMPTAGIGVLVGISDQSNFCKVFRRYRGCSPGIYREQLEKRGRG